jgi:hypothetical protein
MSSITSEQDSPLINCLLAELGSESNCEYESIWWTTHVINAVGLANVVHWPMRGGAMRIWPYGVVALDDFEKITGLSGTSCGEDKIGDAL